MLLDSLRKYSNAEFMSMIDEVCKEVLKDNNKKVGILASPSTIKSKLYQSNLEKKGVKSLVPNKRQQILIEKVIRNIIAGKKLEKDKEKLIKIAEFFKERGADGVILGCTELPLIFPKNYDSKVYNPIDILAKELLLKYYR